jgi:hypothetical protein
MLCFFGSQCAPGGSKWEWPRSVGVPFLVNNTPAQNGGKDFAYNGRERGGHFAVLALTVAYRSSFQESKKRGRRRSEPRGLVALRHA